VVNANASLSDAEVAIAAARTGAAVVRDMYGRRLARIDKGGGDFATTADVEAEKAILAVIRGARPHDAVLGEEGGRQGAHGAARQWLVDPLCGTVNYAVGNMLVAVNVALRDGAAAVADPFSGEIFFTDGKTAHVRRDGTDTVLAPSSVSGLVDVNLDPPFPSAPDFRAVDLLARSAFVERFRPRVVSTTLALTWVAAGKRTAYVTDGGDLSGSVHFAAGIALCKAAGCVVTAVDGAPVGPGARGLIAAADADSHELLLLMIAKPGCPRSLFTTLFLRRKRNRALKFILPKFIRPSTALASIHRPNLGDGVLPAGHGDRGLDVVAGVVYLPLAYLRLVHRSLPVMPLRAWSWVRRSDMPGIIGSTGWDRSSAWIWLFSSTHSTTALSGGSW
jgi:myo-inositol-1(or 4)-monophosphatase